MTQMQPSTPLTLSDVDQGVPHIILGFTGDPDRVERLRELGFFEGAAISIQQKGPFGGDPLAVQVAEMTVAVRRADARLILVKTTDD